MAWHRANRGQHALIAHTRGLHAANQCLARAIRCHAAGCRMRSGRTRLYGTRRNGTDRSVNARHSLRGRRWSRRGLHALDRRRTRWRRPGNGTHTGRDARLALALHRLALDHRVKRQRKAPAARMFRHGPPWRSWRLPAAHGAQLRRVGQIELQRRQRDKAVRDRMEIGAFAGVLGVAGGADPEDRFAARVGLADHRL